MHLTALPTSRSCRLSIITLSLTVRCSCSRPSVFPHPSNVLLDLFHHLLPVLLFDLGDFLVCYAVKVLKKIRQVSVHPVHVPGIDAVAGQAVGVGIRGVLLEPVALVTLVLARLPGAVGSLERLPAPDAAGVLGDGMPRARQADEVVREVGPPLDGEVVLPVVAKVVRVDDLLA